MAEGCSNPQIAKTPHVSLSPVEKHATAVFCELVVADVPPARRRVSAVVAYRDAVDAARRDSSAAG